jgi:DNA primase
MNKEDVLEELNSYGLRVAYISGNQAYMECPFHVDRKPSLAVSLDGKGWYCFSCEDGGSLWYLKSRLDRNDIVLPDKDVTLEEIEIKTIAHMTIEDYDKLPSAIRCNYLIDRGLTDRTVEHWKIRKSELFVVIPIRDKRLEVKGLILRAILSTMSPRYQYTKGLDKNNNLFTDFSSLNRSTLIIVEGAFDCIMTWQNGFKNVVSLLGSSISDVQINMIRDISHNIFLLMDNDDAGKVATQKIAKRLVGDFDVYIPDYSIYASKDPGDMESAELKRVFDGKIDYLKAKNFGIVL